MNIEYLKNSIKHNETVKKKKINMRELMKIF